MRLSKFFICFLLLSFLISCKNNNTPSGPPIPKVKVIELKTAHIPLHKQYIGNVVSIDEVDIRARVKGFLTEKHFIEGKPVEKNQLIYVIDPEPFKAKVELAKGQLMTSIAARDYAKVQYERMKILVQKNDVSKADYDKSFADYQTGIGNVISAEADLKDAEINLSYCFMHSPVDGIISKKNVAVGNLVGGTEDTVLATVVQLHPIYVEFNPSVSDYSEMLKYRENMPFKAIATLPFNNKLTFHGEVDLVNNQAEIQTSTILMRATMQNEEHLLLPGIYVNIDILLTDNAPALLVPTTAIMDVQDEQSAFVVNKDNKIEVRKVKVSGQYEGNYIVLSGLKENDKVVLEGLQKLPAGQLVEPIISDKNG